MQGDRTPDGRSASATTGALLAEAAERLAASGSESPRLDASVLLQHATGWSRETLLAHPERLVPGPAVAGFQRLLAGRAAHEPVAYLVGHREFYGRVFQTDRRALIPRPETEALVEVGVQAARRWLLRGVQPLVVDVGTGSGAVAVSVAAEAPVRVVALDVSFDALCLAATNARVLGQASRVRLVQADLVAPIRTPIHVLLANLPYLPADRHLAREVAEHEPRGALVGGEMGTEIVARLLREAQPLLHAGSEAAFEIDEGQGTALVALAARLYPDARIDVRRDAAGLERVLWLRLPG